MNTVNEATRLEQLWTYIGDSELAFQIGATWWFPLLESIHVLAVVTLVGSVIMADLRILQRVGTKYPISSFVPEHTRWVWLMLLPALLTGAALFISQPQRYADNVAFQIKIVLLLAAALNLFLLYRLWNPHQKITLGAKYCATVSVTIWVGVVLAGRWIGHIS